MGSNCSFLNNTGDSGYHQKDMATLHMTEAELVKNITTVLAKVREGAEIVVEQDHQTIAFIQPSQPSGRLLPDILREAKQRNSTITLDDGFGKDLEEIIASNQQSWNPPSWD